MVAVKGSEAIHSMRGDIWALPVGNGEWAALKVVEVDDSLPLCVAGPLHWRGASPPYLAEVSSIQPSKVAQVALTDIAFENSVLVGNSPVRVRFPKVYGRRRPRFVLMWVGEGIIDELRLAAGIDTSNLDDEAQIDELYRASRKGEGVWTHTLEAPAAKSAQAISESIQGSGWIISLEQPRTPNGAWEITAQRSVRPLPRQAFEMLVRNVRRTFEMASATHGGQYLGWRFQN